MLLGFGPTLLLIGGFIWLTNRAAGQALPGADANVRNVKSFFSVHRAKFETRIALPATA